MTFPDKRKDREGERGKKKKKRKGDVLSGIIWRTLLLCISSNNMLSALLYRQREKDGTHKNPHGSFFLLLFSSIDRVLFV
jgi:hypothetical protein